MVWIIAFLCLGVVGATGYYRGPARAAFSFFGLMFGAVLAGPLSPLTNRLLPFLGLSHPVWHTFAPQALGFLMVLIIFKIAGQALHSKIAAAFQYKADETTLYRWQRCHARLGFCVGLLNGSVYFLLLLIPIYAAGYFTAEAATGEGEPAGARFLTDMRTQLHALKLDRVLAAYDPVPAKVYQAADIADLIFHNPLLESRLERYPPLLELAERPEFKSLGKDVQLQQMIQTQAKISDILQHPAVQTLLTNGAIISQVSDLIGPDLDDLKGYLMTGESAKYDLETILGVWDIDRAETMAQLRKRHPGLTPLKLREKERDLFPRIAGLSLTAMPDNQIILKQPNPDTLESTVVSSGTWKKEDARYQVNLPGTLPETSEIEIEGGRRLFLLKFGYVLAFDKET